MKKIFFILLFFISRIALCIESDVFEYENNKVSLLLAEKEENKIALGIEFKLSEGWKIYWKYPGDSGLPPEIKVLNKVKSTIDIKWPFPKELYEKDIDLTTRVYENLVILPVYIKLLNNNKKELETLRLNLDFQICKEICIPLNNTFDIEIPEKNLLIVKNKKKIQDFEKLVPKEISYSKKYKKNGIIINEDNIVLSLKKNIVEEKSDSLNKVMAFLHHENTDTLRFVKYENNKNVINLFLTGIEEQNIDRISNLLAFVKLDNEILFWNEDKVILKEGRTSVSEFNILIIFLFATIGGFILNFMPCVLPVLGLKINSFIQQMNYKEKNKIKLSSLSIVLGIITTFLLIGLITYMLRILGISVGWGLQFQSKIFIITIIIVLTLFTLNLLGYFDIKLPKFVNKIINRKNLNENQNIYFKNYLTGILSTILATPCTAPFVGTAVSIALTQSFLISILIFFFMALGKAFPYIAFIFYPNILSYLPKPGKWFLYLKYFFAMLLLLTIIWLFSLLTNNNKNRYEYKLNGWEEFSYKKIENYLKEDKLIFVDVTAKWCITCKINKKLVLEDKEIIELFDKNEVKKLRADWTDRDSQILEYISSYDKYGIPFNILYSKKDPKGIIFHEILSKKSIKKAINKVRTED